MMVTFVHHVHQYIQIAKTKRALPLFSLKRFHRLRSCLPVATSCLYPFLPLFMKSRGLRIGEAAIILSLTPVFSVIGTHLAGKVAPIARNVKVSPQFNVCLQTSCQISTYSTIGQPIRLFIIAMFYLPPYPPRNVLVTQGLSDTVHRPRRTPPPSPTALYPRYRVPCSIPAKGVVCPVRFF